MPVAETETVPPAFGCGLRLLGSFFGGVGFHGGSGFGRGDDYCFGAPEVGRDFGYFVGRIAEFRDEAIEGGLAGLVGFRYNLLEFLETFVAEDFLGGGIVVETAHGGAQRGEVESGALAAFYYLRNKNRLGVGVLFAQLHDGFHMGLEVGGVG